MRQCADVVRVLRAHGARDAPNFGGNWPVHLAAIYAPHSANATADGAAAPVDEMFALFVDTIDQPGFAQQTALMLAAMQRNEAGARALLDLGADVGAADALGETALHFAAATGDLSLVRLLAARGADLDAVSARSESPAGTAFSNGKIAAALLLVHMGAAVTTLWGQSERSIDPTMFRRAPLLALLD